MFYLKRQLDILETEKKTEEALEDLRLMKGFYESEFKDRVKAEKERDHIHSMLTAEIDQYKAKISNYESPKKNEKKR